MSKRIAFCADGTWDSSTSHTNVYKLYKALTTSADQMPLYDDGVGASANPILKIVGGAFGTGLWQKIKDGYTKIAQLYEAGDPLFIFGFSRGAYTARSLAGMIVACGLPTQDFCRRYGGYRLQCVSRQIATGRFAEQAGELQNGDPRYNDGWRVGYRWFTRNSFCRWPGRSRPLWLSGHQSASQHQECVSSFGDG